MGWKSTEPDVSDPQTKFQRIAVSGLHVWSRKPERLKLLQACTQKLQVERANLPIFLVAINQDLKT